MFVILTYLTYFAVVICHTTTNFKLDQSVFAIHDSQSHILESVRMTAHRWSPKPAINYEL
jgi:hypothetical protein